LKGRFSPHLVIGILVFLGLEGTGLNDAESPVAGAVFEGDLSEFTKVRQTVGDGRLVTRDKQKS
jgi:hypothetical protein